MDGEVRQEGEDLGIELCFDPPTDTWQATFYKALENYEQPQPTDKTSDSMHPSANTRSGRSAPSASDPSFGRDESQAPGSSNETPGEEPSDWVVL